MTYRYYHSFKSKLFLLNVLICSIGLPSLLAQASLLGQWVPTQADLPAVNISASAEGIQVTAERPCALGSCQDLTATVFNQRIAHNSQEKIQVRFLLPQGEAFLNLESLGGFLMAKWHINGRQGIQEYETTYRRVTTMTTRSRGLHTGSIEGKAVGKARSTAGFFAVSLYGPDNPRRFVRTQPLGRYQQYRFSGLEDGVYWLYVEGRGQSAIHPTPSQMQIVIKNGEGIVRHISFD